MLLVVPDVEYSIVVKFLVDVCPLTGQEKARYVELVVDVAVAGNNERGV